MASGKSDPQVLQSICEQGLALHRADRLDEAAAQYERVLRRNPKHFDALRLLGLIRVRTGQAETAISLLRRALKANPTFADVHCVLGGALCGLGRPADALASYDAAIALRPDYAEAHNDRGVALSALGRPADALASLDVALALKPDYVQAHNTRGKVLHALGRHEEALASFETVIALRPDHLEARINRAITLSTLGRHEEALASCDGAIALKRDHADAHFNRGVALHHLGRPAEALASYDVVIALDPARAAAHNNRATALKTLDRPEEALASYERAIALNPAYAEAHANRGLVLKDLLRLDEALASFEAAIALDPHHTDALDSRAFTLLLGGRLEAGWPAYEDRKLGWPAPERAFDQDRAWRGEALAGQRLFLHHEQGLGDTIQFARYAMLLADAGVDLVLSVQAPLIPLLQPVLPGVTIIGPAERPARFDYHSSLMSLPLAFATTLETIPSQPRPLQADADRRARFEALLGPRTRPRVGIAWSGNPDHKNDHNRSIAFDQLAPLLSDGADWIALQNGIRPSDAAAFEASGRVGYVGDSLADLADAAALVDLMDVVVTVDTSIAHLAGAMGKPVWVLLPYSPDWRWLLGRADSPWYPSARLFRQPAIGDWASVIDTVAGELQVLAG